MSQVGGSAQGRDRLREAAQRRQQVALGGYRIGIARAELEGMGEIGSRTRPIGGLEHAQIGARRVALGEVGGELDGLVCRGESACEVILARVEVPAEHFADHERRSGDTCPRRSVLRIQLDRLAEGRKRKPVRPRRSADEEVPPQQD